MLSSLLRKLYGYRNLNFLPFELVLMANMKIEGKDIRYLRRLYRHVCRYCRIHDMWMKICVKIKCLQYYCLVCLWLGYFKLLYWLKIMDRDIIMFTVPILRWTLVLLLTKRASIPVEQLENEYLTIIYK